MNTTSGSSYTPTTVEEPEIEVKLSSRCRCLASRGDLHNSSSLLAATSQRQAWLNFVQQQKTKKIGITFNSPLFLSIETSLLIGGDKRT